MVMITIIMVLIMIVAIVFIVMISVIMARRIGQNVRHFVASNSDCCATLPSHRGSYSHCPLSTGLCTGSGVAWQRAALFVIFKFLRNSRQEIPRSHQRAVSHASHGGFFAPWAIYCFLMHTFFTQHSTCLVLYLVTSQSG